MKSALIEPFTAQCFAKGTWGFVGRCAYCKESATHQRRSYRQCRWGTTGRWVYTALCTTHAKRASEK